MWGHAGGLGVSMRSCLVKFRSSGDSVVTLTDAGTLLVDDLEERRTKLPFLLKKNKNHALGNTVINTPTYTFLFVCYSQSVQRGYYGECRHC